MLWRHFINHWYLFIIFIIIVIILYSRIYKGCGTRDGVVGGDLARAYNTLSFVCVRVCLCVRERIKRKKFRLDQTHVYGLWRRGATRKRRADTTLLSSFRRVVVGVFVSGGVARVSERKGRLSDAADAVRLQHALVGHAAPPAHASAKASTTAAAGAPTTVTIIIDSTPPPVARARGFRRRPPRGSSPTSTPRRRHCLVGVRRGFPGWSSRSRSREPDVAGYDCVAARRVCSRRGLGSHACFSRHERQWKE